MAGGLAPLQKRSAAAIADARSKIEIKLMEQGREQFPDEVWRKVAGIIDKIEPPMTTAAEAKALIELTAIFDTAFKENA
jgi:hypothetical protein